MYKLIPKPELYHALGMIQVPDNLRIKIGIDAMTIYAGYKSPEQYVREKLSKLPGSRRYIVYIEQSPHTGEVIITVQLSEDAFYKEEVEIQMMDAKTRTIVDEDKPKQRKKTSKEVHVDEEVDLSLNKKRGLS